MSTIASITFEYHIEIYESKSGKEEISYNLHFWDLEDERVKKNSLNHWFHSFRMIMFGITTAS